MAQGNRLTKEEIKRDQFVETVLNFYNFLKKHLKLIIITAAVVVVLVAAMSYYTQEQQQTRAEASLAFAEAIQKYQEAEDGWLDHEKLETSGEQFQTGGEAFQTIFQNYSSTPFADRARYNYARTLYYQGDYAGAIEQFESVKKSRESDNQNFALYAQKAIGNCYEQQGQYEKAIEAYEKLPDILIPVREHALVDAQLSQARCYEKLGRLDDSVAIYKDIIDHFGENLDKAIQEKSRDFIFGRNLTPSVKSLLTSLPEAPSVPEAEKLVSEGAYYKAFIAYADAVHLYKVNREIDRGLTKALRTAIYNFEKKADDFLKNLRDARRYESEGQQSTALYYYDQAVNLDFAPSRNLYETARFHHDRLQHTVKFDDSD
ncbi:MAG: tetratricopeptide repeat protein [Candidatus Poribacteria bacterium]|nr:tetratricopeptide repeat protein [Candidatus Poribacteria bacterium]